MDTAMDMLPTIMATLTVITIMLTMVRKIFIKTFKTFFIIFRSSLGYNNHYAHNTHYGYGQQYGKKNLI